jgi:hypothetical protein
MGTFSELLDYIDAEMKKFEGDLLGEKVNLVISQEEFKVE